MSDKRKFKRTGDPQDDVFIDFAADSKDTGELLEAWVKLRQTRPGDSNPPKTADLLVVNEAKRYLRNTEAVRHAWWRWLALCGAALTIVIIAWFGLDHLAESAAGQGAGIEIISSGGAIPNPGVVARGLGWEDVDMEDDFMVFHAGLELNERELDENNENLFNF